jgi:mono/diheme cytochrome c family protein
MKINIRIYILSSFVVILLLVMCFRSCPAPPKKGELGYEQKCASCHGVNGEGFRNLIPPMNDSAYLAKHIDDFACIVAYGLDEKITVNGVDFDQPMNGIEELNSIEIANVANYVYERWGNTPKKFTPQEIEKRIANCE